MNASGNAGHCHICDEDVPRAGEAAATPGHDATILLDHIRVMHPDQYGDGPLYWPDGGLVVIDETFLD